MTVNGIDVASYQNATFATLGLSFVFVKATEGTGYVNPKHAAQVATGRAHGLVVGHYHYAKPGPVAAQVEYFLQHAAAKAGDILALDWEDPGVPYQDKDAFIKQAQKAAPSHRVLLYCNRDFWVNRDHTSFAGDGLWIADPDAPAGHPRVTHPWVLHQYGIRGADLDVGNFADASALKAWAAKGVKPPAPKPKPTVHYAPFPGAAWFHTGRKSPIVAAMHARLVAVGCNHYQSAKNADVIGSGDIASYEAWQRKYSAQHHKGWSGSALKWPPGRETWDALKIPKP